MKRGDGKSRDESTKAGEDSMKVPIEDNTPEQELDEEAMVEAAIAAGEAAAEEELAAEAEAEFTKVKANAMSSIRDLTKPSSRWMRQSRPPRMLRSA